MYHYDVPYVLYYHFQYVANVSLHVIYDVLWHFFVGFYIDLLWMKYTMLKTELISPFMLNNQSKIDKMSYSICIADIWSFSDFNNNAEDWRFFSIVSKNVLMKIWLW